MPTLDYMVGVVGQSSQDWQWAPQSSKWMKLLCYRKKGCLHIWPDSASFSIQLSHHHNGQSWWFVQVPGSTEGSPLSYPQRQCTSLYPLIEMLTVWQLCMAIQNMVHLSGGCCHCWNLPLIASRCSHPLVGLHRYSPSVDEYQWVPFFLHRGIQWHTFASSTLLCQMLFCQTAPLLPSVTWPSIEHWWEGSTSAATPAYTSIAYIAGYQHKIEGKLLLDQPS